MTLRDLANVAIYRLSIGLLRLRLFFQKHWLLGPYQPDPFASPTQVDKFKGRGSFDRFNAIALHLPDGPLSAMDIGCNEGFFIFSLAQRGGFCIGIDQDRNTIMAANARAAIHRCNNVVFANHTVDVDFAKGLPDVDVVICLSVFHHLVRHLGLSKAKQNFAAISAHAKSYLIFETGQPNEQGAQWAHELSFMDPDHQTWVKGFLAELGFPNVVVLGDFATTVSPTPRTLFVARRS